MESIKRANQFKNAVFIEIASYLLIILFLYAAISKLVIFSEFQEQMSQSPLIPRNLIPFLAIFIPISELIIVWLLVFEKTLKVGFYLSFFTMLTFTIYIVALVTFAENVPCACGGILGSLGYFEHIVFNILFTLIALFGYIKLPSK